MIESPISPREVFADLTQSSRAKHRRWTLPQALPYFDGHFPEGAILPAVAIVDASLCIVASLMGVEDLRLLEVSGAKFTQTIGPGDEVVIKATPGPPGEWTVDWRGANEDPADKPYVWLKLKVGTDG